MKQYFFLIFFLTSSLFSTEGLNTTETSQEATVSALVDGCVNAITGDYINSANDLAIVGPEPLVLERFHSSSDYFTNSFLSGWRHSHDSWIRRWREREGDKKTMVVVLVEKTGRAARYEADDRSDKQIIKLKLDIPPNSGLTNIGSGVLSAKTNPKNTKLEYDRSTKNVTVKMPTGAELVFNQQGDYEGFDLILEKRPNGHQLQYEYDKKGYLTGVFYCDKTGDKHYSSFEVEDNRSNSFEPNLKVTASNGQSVLYNLERIKATERDKKHSIGKRYLLKSVQHSHGLLEEFEYVTRRVTEGELISKHIKPDGRIKEIRYYNDKDKGSELEKTDHSVNKVQKLKAPVGKNEKLHTTYRFAYHATRTTADEDKCRVAISGYTDVFNAHQHKTTYHFERHKLTAVEKFLGTEKYDLYTTERYYWNGQDDIAMLSSKLIEDAQKQVITCRRFEYDPHGNIIKDTIYGNISGKSAPLVCTEGTPNNNGIESYSKRFVYADHEGKHQMHHEIEDNGKSIAYSYYPESKQMRFKLITQNDKICQRYYFEYDENDVLCKTIIDNGCRNEAENLEGVTQRRITYTKPRKTAPVGVPEETIEKFLDLATGKEQLLKRIKRQFSPQGQILKEDYYDANDDYCYSKSWEYDLRGNVIKEINPLGQETIRTYDIHCNLLTERNAGEQLTKFYTYDYSNRLIGYLEQHDDGTRLATTHHYNYLGQRIKTIDPYGNETEYQYDALGRLILTKLPPIPDCNGVLIRHIEEKTYDVLDNISSHRDALGNLTSYTYNIHGKPLTIVHPDQSQEQFIYALDGTLKEYTSRTGSVTKYQRDCFDRVLKKEQFGSAGELLNSETFTYDGINLISTTNYEGIKTTYSYDCAGRIIKVDCNEHVTEYAYDALGHQYKQIEWYNGEQAKTTIKSYDLLDRVIEERVEEDETVLSRILSEYDSAGNIVARKEFTRKGEQIATYTTYNSNKLPIKIVDPLGNITAFQYDHNHIDSNGIVVLKTILTDPLGNQTMTILDALGHVAKIEKFNRFGQLIAKKELVHNALGDLVLNKETAIAKFTQTREVLTRWHYDNMRQVNQLTEAVGTTEQKITRFTYINGLKTQQIKPDGTTVNFEYDSKGRLIRQWSSDRTIDYQFSYDFSDHIIRAYDLKNKQETVRSYDHNGRLIYEKLGNQLAVEYQYDHFGRPIEVILPDGSKVRYAYNATDLLEIDHRGQKSLYTDYQQTGLPSILQTAEVAQKTTYDPLKRPQEIDCRGKLTAAYDAMGNATKVQIKGTNYDIDADYQYDDLYQLKIETGVAQHTYQNDSLYNCVNRDGKTRIFNALNQMKQEGDTVYTYDANGNLIKQEGERTIEYVYDALDRLIAYMQDGKRTNYQYDPFNRRLAKISQATTTHYIYQGENEVGAVDQAGNWQLRILGVGRGAEIGASVLLYLKGCHYVPVHDHNGNIVSLCDLQGKVVESYRYSAFGEEKIFGENGEHLVKSAYDQFWRYSSKRIDEESGLIYFGRRYYDPRLARWLTPDPLGYVAGANLYAYVMNSPLSHIDLYGLMVSQMQSMITSFASHVHSFFNWGMGQLSNIATYPGRCVEFVGYHLIPVPIVHDVVTTCGRFLAGDGWKPESWHEEKSLRICSERGSPSTNGIDNSFCHGMLNTFSNALGNLNLLADSIGSIVFGVHPSSHGGMPDIISCLALKLGFLNESVLKMAEDLEYRVANLKEGWILHHRTHSRGALVTEAALRLLSAEVRARIFVSNFGGATIIDAEEHGLLGASNYINLADPIPFIADPIGCVKGAFSTYGNVQFLKPKTYGFEHAFLGPTYQAAFYKDTNDIIRRYGR